MNSTRNATVLVHNLLENRDNLSDELSSDNRAGVKLSHGRFMQECQIMLERQINAKMSDMERNTTKVDSAGRIVLPAEARKAMGLKPGSEVIVRFEDGEVRVTTREEALRKVQEMVRRHVPEGVSLVDELIAERRAEAKREIED